MPRVILTISFLLIIVLPAYAQHPGRTCGTPEYNQAIEDAFPDVRERRAEIQTFTNGFVRDFNSFREVGAENVIVIPVVVHVIYHPSYPAQNIPYNRVVQQINVLNQDFRAMNADTVGVPALFKPLVADAEIQFCLATRDPGGNWTNGVTYTQSTKTGFSMSDDASIKSTFLGGHDPWDRDKYMNIWVCNLTGNVLGYTQLPGGPAYLDGLVIGFKYFGLSGATAPYNKGRTTTHEVGHWLNLYHIWGDDNGACWGSDFCDDTPNQGGDNYACPTFPKISCGNTSDMFMNYMDYVDDACMFMFTPDQKARMWATLNGPRASLLTSDGCLPATGLPDPRILRSLEVYPLPAGNQINVVAELNAPVTCSISLFDGLGRLLHLHSLQGVQSVRYSIDMDAYPRGVYMLRVEADGNVETRMIPRY